MFSCKFAAYFQNTFFYEHLWRAASEHNELDQQKYLKNYQHTREEESHKREAEVPQILSLNRDMSLLAILQDVIKNNIPPTQPLNMEILNPCRRKQ